MVDGRMVEMSLPCRHVYFVLRRDSERFAPENGAHGWFGVLGLQKRNNCIFTAGNVTASLTDALTLDCAREGAWIISDESFERARRSSRCTPGSSTRALVTGLLSIRRLRADVKPSVPQSRGGLSKPGCS